MQVKGPNAGCGTHHFCSPGAKHAHGLPGVITFPSSLVSDRPLLLLDSCKTMQHTTCENDGTTKYEQ